MAISPAEIIQRRRVELGLSQAQLGERLGRAASTVRRWERGDASPPESIMATLASALQVSERDLAVAFGADDPGPEPQPNPQPEPARVSAAVEDQPTVAAPAPAASAVDRAGQKAAAASSTVASPPQQRRRSPRLRAPALATNEGLSYLEDSRQRVRYWIRAALTIVVGIILLLILVWAVGELGAAIGEVWSLFGEDAPPVTSPGTDF